MRQLISKVRDTISFAWWCTTNYNPVEARIRINEIRTKHGLTDEEEL